MKKVTVGILSFGIGGAIGYFIASVIERNKANKRVEEIKEEFKKPHKLPRKLMDNPPEAMKDPDADKTEGPKIEIEGWAPDKESFKQYDTITHPYTGETYHTIEKGEEKVAEQTITPNAPYVISIEEFDTIGYETKYWSVFDDDVVETDDGRTLRWQFSENNNTSELSSLLCDDAVYRLTEYDEDVVYVRDDENRIDYELLKERKSYFKQ